MAEIINVEMYILKNSTAKEMYKGNSLKTRHKPTACHSVLHRN